MRDGSTWSMRRCREAGLAVFEAGFEGGSMEGGPRRGGAVGDEVVAGGRARDDDYRAVGAAKVNVTAD